jgi:hypothetical protein
MNQQQIDDIKARHSKATAELHRLCDGGKFTMCVPVQETDTDILINRSLHDVAFLVDEVEQLRAVLEAIANARHVRYVPYCNEGYFQDGIEEGLRMANDMARAALEDQP